MGICNWCKKRANRLYECRGWDVCWNCYWEDVDKEVKENDHQEKAKNENTD